MLAAEIEAAKQRELIAALDAGEKAVAESHAYLLIAPELDPGDVELLKPWLTWCRDKSVRNVPAKVWCVAAYVLDRHKQGAPESEIFDELGALERLHDKWRLPNPVTTAIVSAVLDTIIKDPAPRSWTKQEQEDWPLLPPTIKAAIARRERERDIKLRQLQNELADLKKQLKPDEPKAVATEKEEV